MSTPPDVANLNLSVLSAIEEHKAKDSSAFLRHWLSYEDVVVLLQILVKALRNQQMSEEDCTVHLDRHPSLGIKLVEAYRSREFDKLLDNPDMPLQPAILSRKPSSSHPNLKTAFEEPYKGETPALFVKTLNKMRSHYGGISAADSPYNWSIEVIQSSGMGKSRMVDESSSIVFTFPFNIRGDPPKGKKAYPPSDRTVYNFFNQCANIYNDAEQQVAYGIFFKILFTDALTLLQTQFQGLTGQDLARAWTKYLKAGETEDEVGVNRREFYTSVVNKANNWLQAPNRPTMNGLVRSLTESCFKLEKHLENYQSDDNACFLYFDEAHSLIRNVRNPSPEYEQSAYHNLGVVLSELTDHKIFFIFISTNSRLKGLAPPAANSPSFRVTTGSRLIPPFTELPFDVYERDVLTSRSITLENMCTTEAMAGFGRALWHAELHIRPDNNIHNFAIDKLTALGVPHDESDSLLALLGVRVGITFDKFNRAAILAESRLVESHQRVIYVIPEHRRFMRTGSPSEPILAEAASRYLNRPSGPGIAIEGPNWLSAGLENGLLDQEERRELVGRLLVTCAHDIALDKIVEPSSHEPQYHRPLPVLDFLCALFHEDHHETILNAMPIINQTEAGQPCADPLRNAFSESYVFFSHFVIAEDEEMLSTFALATALVRGMAVQAMDGQASIDAVIPIHMGSLTDPISPKTTSAINLQFRNRKTAFDCYVDRSITIPHVEMPVISIIFEFGITETSDPISITSEPPEIILDQDIQPHRDDRHYQIVARGCSSRVFGAIPLKMEEKYKSILGTGAILQDFPRNRYPENREALLQMKPVFNGERQKGFYSDTLNEMR